MNIVEQEVVFLMDRLGFARTVDTSVYERNKEAADSENRYVVHCMNTGRLCIFTDTGRMHQVKVLDVPYGKFRDKGTPIDNISNYSTSEEQIVMVCDSEQMRFSHLLFATSQGRRKRRWACAGYASRKRTSLKTYICLKREKKAKCSMEKKKSH